MCFHQTLFYNNSNTHPVIIRIWNIKIKSAKGTGGKIYYVLSAYLRLAGSKRLNIDETQV